MLEANPTPQPSRTAWIPEAPAHPGLYAVRNGPLPQGRNCTMNPYEAREFTTFEACAKWCEDNQVPPFVPMEHTFVTAPTVLRQILDGLAQGEADVASGNTVPAEEVMRSLKEKYGDRAPLVELSELVSGDPEYAWTLHCNIAMPILDSGACGHQEANKAAARVMGHLFGVDTSKHPNFPQARPEEVIKAGDRIRIKENIGAVLQELGFDPGIPEEFQRKYAGTEQIAHSVWLDPGSKELYATIDLCCEIPIRCCELIPR